MFVEWFFMYIGMLLRILMFVVLVYLWMDCYWWWKRNWVVMKLLMLFLCFMWIVFMVFGFLFWSWVGYVYYVFVSVYWFIEVNSVVFFNYIEIFGFFLNFFNFFLSFFEFLFISLVVVFNMRGFFIVVILEEFICFIGRGFGRLVFFNNLFFMSFFKEMSKVFL